MQTADQMPRPVVMVERTEKLFAMAVQMLMWAEMVDQTQAVMVVQRGWTAVLEQTAGQMRLSWAP